MGQVAGVELTPEEWGKAPAVMTEGNRQRPEEVLVATGQSDVRVTYSFKRDDDRRECILEFTCRFPADEHSHGADWAKAALAEAALRDVLSGEDPYSLPDDLPELTLRGEEANETGEG